MSNNQTPDYYIAPKGSFDATADAIRNLTGSQASITWGQNGFADAEEGITDAFLSNTLSGDIKTTLTTISRNLSKFTAITSFYAPNCTLKPENMFDGCTNLVSINFPVLQNMFTTSNYFCRGCTSLTTVKLPDLRRINGGNLFENCTSLQTFVLPSLTKGQGSNNSQQSAMLGNMFKNSGLKTLDLLASWSFNANAFYGCASLDTIIIREKVSAYPNALHPTLGDVSAFDGTPFASGGTGGTIYLPKVIYDELGTGNTWDFKAATNWSTVDGYGTITWAKIEGSYYETHYADGTLIPTT